MFVMKNVCLPQNTFQFWKHQYRCRIFKILKFFEIFKIFLKTYSHVFVSLVSLSVVNLKEKLVRFFFLQSPYSLPYQFLLFLLLLLLFGGSYYIYAEFSYAILPKHRVMKWVIKEASRGNRVPFHWQLGMVDYTYTQQNSKAPLLALNNIPVPFYIRHKLRATLFISEKLTLRLKKLCHGSSES